MKNGTGAVGGDGQPVFGGRLLIVLITVTQVTKSIVIVGRKRLAQDREHFVVKTFG